MTRQTTAPLTEHNLAATNRRAHELAVTMHEQGWLDLTPPYQRGAVWTEDQQIGLVRSWLQRIPVPAVILNDRTNPAYAAAHAYPADGKGLYGVVDGQQRIRTAIAWFDGTLAVPASWFDPAEVDATEQTADGPYVRYTGLTRLGKSLTDSRAMLPVIEARLGSVQEEASLFLLVNGAGSPQTDEDMARAAGVAAGGA